MKSYCLYCLININSSYYCKYQRHNLAHPFILSKIFYPFRDYIAKAYKCIYPHSEKRSYVLFEKCRIAPLVLHLKQWYFAYETESLIQIQYASKPKNPE